MHLDGLSYNKNRTKSVNAVGSVLRFSPHGDSSVYQACVRLTNDSVMYPLIDGKGSFSSITTRDIQAGASRYTEMRLSPITQEILKDIDKNVVDMVNNYDDTRLEPTDLPVTFPLVLANPNIGIAVGIASNICSFNLTDIVDNTINI
jgi:DNA gyrase/topoisomerase IV subunit A